MAEERPLPDLDNLAIYARTDPSAAHTRLFDLAGQCRAAWEIVREWKAPTLPAPPRAVIVAGMGGSAIGGDLLRALAIDQCTIPIIVHRDYGLPAYAGPQTLVLASSYSGNTEETLSAAEEAFRRGCPLIAVTTGGELARRAQARGLPLIVFDYPAQPRECLGYGLLLLLGALVRLGLVSDPTPEVESSIATLEEVRAEMALEVPRTRNPAKELAHWLYGGFAYVFGAGRLAPVARRWKGQFNENSKAWACFEELPELDHNLVAGTFHPAGFAGQVRAVFLSSAYDHPRNRLRLDITRSILEEAGTPCRTIAARGDSPLAQVLSSVLLGDISSYYLAVLYGADPTLIPAIHALKAALARA